MTIYFKLFYLLLLHGILTCSTKSLVHSKHLAIARIMKCTRERDVYTAELNKINNALKLSAVNENVGLGRSLVNSIEKCNLDIINAQSELRGIEEKIRNNVCK